MTAPESVPLAAWLEENLGSASPDLLRRMVKTFAEALMSADADAVCGAEYGRPSRSGSSDTEEAFHGESERFRGISSTATRRVSTALKSRYRRNACACCSLSPGR